MAKSQSNNESKPEQEVVEVVEKQVVDSLSPEWTDYVLSLFTEDELVDGNPLVSGLRRVAEKLVGTVISSKPTQVFPVVGEGMGRATVVYEVRFVGSDGIERQYADVADVWAGNVDPEFLTYAVAVAATRAEGRALRKALKLKKVVAAEELTRSPAHSSSYANEDMITQNQINFIDKTCRALNINAMKFINAGKGNYSHVSKVLKKTANDMVKVLNTLEKDRSLIDAEITGYESSWYANN